MNDEIKEILEEFLKEKGAYSLRYSFNGDLAYSQEQMLKDYITNLQKENETLKEQKKEAIEVINTQMKGLSKDEAGNLRIIKFNLIKGSCTPLDLTTEEDYKY